MAWCVLISLLLSCRAHRAELTLVLAQTDHLVLRSQLDAHNEHLPNKTFDLKTRGTVAIRQDRLNYEVRRSLSSEA